MSGSVGCTASPLERDERWARVAWSFLAEPRDAGTSRRLAEVGAVEALAELRAGGLRERSGWDRRGWPTSTSTTSPTSCDHQRLHVLVPGDDGWPPGLDRLRRPPYCLFVRGEPDLATLVERSVAIVGSRAATDYGLRVAADLADGLCARGWTVISGAAYGIDAAAHRAALATGGTTVAVLACGAEPRLPDRAPGAARRDRPDGGGGQRGAAGLSRRTARASSRATGSSPRWPAPRWSSRPACARGR